MTRKQRQQYMALSVVEGYVYYARNIHQLGSKSHKSFNRINARCAAMKESIGQPDINTDIKHLLNKQERVQRTLNKHSDDDNTLDVMFYTNAVIMMVNRMQDNIPDMGLQREWSALEGMMFTLYTHLEEIDKIEFVQDANDMGVEMTLAVLK